MDSHFPRGIDSRFRYVLLVAKRAEQLIQGSMAKIKTRHKKPTRIAMAEVAEDRIKWQLTPPPQETETVFPEQDGQS